MSIIMKLAPKISGRCTFVTTTGRLVVVVVVRANYFFYSKSGSCNLVFFTTKNADKKARSNIKFFFFEIGWQKSRGVLTNWSFVKHVKLYRNWNHTYQFHFLCLMKLLFGTLQNLLYLCNKKFLDFVSWQATLDFLQ